MSTEIVPLHPRALSADEAEGMLQRQLKKHDVAIVLLHWFNAATWGLELLTGLALVSAGPFGVVPRWYASVVGGLFGGPANLLRFHIALGVAWIFVFVVYGVFGHRTYLRHEVLDKEVALDRDDVRWLVVRILGILGRSREPLPPQGIYNAGQKLFAMMIYAMIPVVMVTGVIMALRLFGPAVVGWAVVVHFAAVGAVVSGLLVHVYMGAIFPEEKAAFFSMITGAANELYAYTHHYKWWREAKLAQLARRTRQDEAFAAATRPRTEEPTPPAESPPPAD